MKYFFQHKNGQVASYSESKIEALNFEQIELNVTPTELELMKQNYILKIEKKKLVFEKPQRIIKEEQVEELKQKVATAKTINDVKDIILSLLSK